MQNKNNPTFLGMIGKFIGKLLLLTIIVIGGAFITCGGNMAITNAIDTDILRGPWAGIWIGEIAVCFLWGVYMLWVRK